MDLTNPENSSTDSKHQNSILLPEKKLKKDPLVRVKKSSSAKGLRDLGFEAGTNVTTLLKTIAAKESKDEKTLKKSALALQINRNKGVIGLPQNLEAVTSDLFIRKVLQINLEIGIQVEPTPGNYVPLESTADDDFWSGFFSELMSKTLVERVHFSKTSQFVNGKACARYELIKGLVPSDNQSWIRHVHKEIIGTKAVKPLLERMAAKRYKTETESTEILAFLRDLAHLVSGVPGYGITKINFLKFFDRFEELFAACKRRKKVTDRKSKKKKETLTTVNATRPSLLKSVLPYEKLAVQEIWEEPWQQLEQLRASYEAADPRNINRSDLMTRLRTIITKQWSCKGKVQAQTKHRIVKASHNSNLREDLTATQAVTSKIVTEDLYIEYITLKERHCPIFPVGNYSYQGRTWTSFYAFLGEVGQHIYPHAHALKLVYDTTGISKRLEKAEGLKGAAKRKDVDDDVSQKEKKNRRDQ
jgi:hypothetical protein